MDIGFKYNLNSINPSPRCDWLTVPNFRIGQPFPSQHYLAKATSLKDDGYKLHGHPLLNIRRMPDNIETFLIGVTEGFEDLIDSWDVINEMSNHVDRGDYWHAKPFELMRELCPDAKLFINEYAIQNPQYWNGVLSLAERLKSDGLVDGIGIQCRSDIRDKIPGAFDYGASLLVQPMPTPKLNTIIDNVHGLGLDCHLSEVTCLHSPGQEKTATALVQRYRNTGEAKKVSRFTYWEGP